MSSASATSARVAAHQRDAGGLHRDVGAGRHRDADVGGGQRRRVVDAVADHRHDLARGAQRAARPRPCRPAAPRRAPRRCRAARATASRAAAVVAGQQHGLARPARAAAATACARRRLERVAEGQQAEQRGRRRRPGDEPGDRAALAPRSCSAALPARRRRRPVRASGACCRARSAAPSDLRLDAAARQARGPRARSGTATLSARAALAARRAPADARCRAAARRRAAAPRRARSPAAALDGRPARPALGQRAGLVEGDRSSPRARAPAPRRP